MPCLDRENSAPLDDHSRKGQIGSWIRISFLGTAAVPGSLGLSLQYHGLLIDTRGFMTPWARSHFSRTASRLPVMNPQKTRGHPEH